MGLQITTWLVYRCYTQNWCCQLIGLRMQYTKPMMIRLLTSHNFWLVCKCHTLNQKPNWIGKLSHTKYQCCHLIGLKLSYTTPKLLYVCSPNVLHKINADNCLFCQCQIYKCSTSEIKLSLHSIIQVLWHSIFQVLLYNIFSLLSTYMNSDLTGNRPRCL